QLTFSAPVVAGGASSAQTMLDSPQAQAPASAAPVPAAVAIPPTAPPPTSEGRGFPWGRVLIGLGALVVLGIIAVVAILVVGGFFLAPEPVAPVPPVPPAQQPAQPTAPVVQPTVAVQQPPAAAPPAAAPPSGPTQAAPVGSVPGSCADDSLFLTDITIPDGTVLSANATFVKTWEIQNTGTCTWDGYNLVWISDARMNAAISTPVGRVEPGQTIQVSVTLVAPPAPGEHRANFQMQNASGARFGDMPYVIVIVQI
ncbi:MAG: NBR1-Ig-like domain-containing protein, partial [Planctomycetota bacterium]